MDFPFKTCIKVGDTPVAEVEGYLLLSAMDDGCAPWADYVDWTVEEIHLHGFATSAKPAQAVELTADHWLHDRILAQVLDEHRNRIDELWRERMAQQIGAARRRFRLTPANV